MSSTILLIGGGRPGIIGNEALIRVSRCLATPEAAFLSILEGRYE